jgi:hypothetical protein
MKRASTLRKEFFDNQNKLISDHQEKIEAFAHEYQLLCEKYNLVMTHQLSVKKIIPVWVEHETIIAFRPEVQP